MTCRDCTNAAAKRWHGFTGECKGCCARAASRSPHYQRCRDNGVQDREYRGLLQQFDLTHDEVRAAAQSDAMSRSNWTAKPAAATSGATRGTTP